MADKVPDYIRDQHLEPYWNRKMTDTPEENAKKNSRTLTIEQAGTLAAILRGVERNLKVRYYPRGAADDAKPMVMVMRAFTQQGGGFYPYDSDIRDAHVWCSGIMEHWIKVSDLMRAIENVNDGKYGYTEPMAVIDEE